MGKFTCLGCNRSIEADSPQEAMDKFDHAIALSAGRNCPNNPRDFRWNDLPIPGVHPDLLDKPVPVMATKPTKTTKATKPDT